MATRPTKQKVNSDKILFKQHIELSNIRVLRMFYLLITEIFLTIHKLTLNFNPERLMMFGQKTLMKSHQSPCSNVFFLVSFCLEFKAFHYMVDIQEKLLTVWG